MTIPSMINAQLTVKSLGYTIGYSKRLARTGKNYHDSHAGIPRGQRMSTAGEEFALYHSTFLPQAPSHFSDLFGRNDARWQAHQLTATGLRVPKGCDAQAYETDNTGRKYWRRIVLLDDREAGEVFVPEGNGRAVGEWYKEYGLPRTTLDAPLRITNFLSYVFKSDAKFTAVWCNARFWFNPAPARGPASGHADIAIMCYGRRDQTANVDLWALDATRERSYVSANLGLRVVQEIKSEAGASALEKTLARRTPPQLPQSPERPPSVLTESARDLLRQTESSSEKLRRQLTERPVDNLLRQMQAPPRWQPPYRS